MTATTAALATHSYNQKEVVASVATVTVTNTLPQEDEEFIRAWLAHINERDPVIINEVLNECRTSYRALHIS